MNNPHILVKHDVVGERVAEYLGVKSQGLQRKPVRLSKHTFQAPSIYFRVLFLGTFISSKTVKPSALKCNTETLYITVTIVAGILSDEDIIDPYNAPQFDGLTR